MKLSLSLKPNTQNNKVYIIETLQNIQIYEACNNHNLLNYNYLINYFVLDYTHNSKRS